MEYLVKDFLKWISEMNFVRLSEINFLTYIILSKMILENEFSKTIILFICSRKKREYQMRQFGYFHPIVWDEGLKMGST